MAKKHMKIFNVVVPFVTVVILVSQIVGALFMSEGTLLDMMKDIHDFEIEIAVEDKEHSGSGLWGSTGSEHSTGTTENNQTIEQDPNAGIVDTSDNTLLTESELHKIFEGAYLESIYNMRFHLGKSAEFLLLAEHTRIEQACPLDKELPEDYKEQYRVWRENYEVVDLSYLFMDMESDMSVIGSTYTYINIFTDSKVELLVEGEVVKVTGYGYDKADGWYRIQMNTGSYYVQAKRLAVVAESVQNEVSKDFIACDKVMYAISDEANIMMEPKVSSDKVDSLSVGDSVHIIGAGKYALTGWYKVEVNGQEYYILGRYLSDTKPTSSNQGSQSQGNTSNQSGNSSQSNGSSSGGTQDSGGQQNGTSNSGGQQSSGSSYCERMYGMTGEYIRDNLTDEEKIALGFTQRSNGTWVDETGYMLPSPEPTEEEWESINESSEGVKWGSG